MLIKGKNFISALALAAITGAGIRIPSPSVTRRQDGPVPNDMNAEDYAKYRHFMLGAPRSEIAAWNRRIVNDKLRAGVSLRRQEQLLRGL